MVNPLDIFKSDSDGSVLWRGAAENLAAAKVCIKKWAVSCPGEYLVLNQQTGDQIRITLPNNLQAGAVDVTAGD
jgi:hypothetical protein